MFSLRSVFPLLALFVLSLSASAQTSWFVDVNATPPGDGSFASPFTSIQGAIDHPGVQSGDSLVVFPGTYDERIDYSGKALEITRAVGFDVDSTLGGRGRSWTASTLTLRDCVISSCEADVGGVVFADTSHRSGGRTVNVAVYAESSVLQLTGTTLSFNQAGDPRSCTLCVGLPGQRTPIQNAGGSGVCGGVFSFHFSQALMSATGLRGPRITKQLLHTRLHRRSDGMRGQLESQRQRLRLDRRRRPEHLRPLLHGRLAGFRTLW